MAFKPFITKLCLILALTIQVLGQEDSICRHLTSIPQYPRPEDWTQPDFTGTTWSTRPLIPGPDRLDVCMDNYEGGNSVGTQTIHMEEEIEGEVIIAKLNYYGDETPIISLFRFGQRNMLQAVIRREPTIDNDWYLVVTNKQDYETPEMQQYLFDINIDNENFVARVSLQIVNIDDNAPVIEVFDTCTEDELGTVPRVTRCVYEVSDADGEISTRFMSFEISSNRGDEQIFSIQQENIPNNWFRMTMTLVLEQTLDYEASAFHIFSVTASDSLPNNHTVSLMVQVQNIDSRPPRWAEFWSVQQFDEKTNQTFPLRAIDGDTGIDREIFYRLEKDPSYTFFSLVESEDARGGVIFDVREIDRDTLEQEVFTCTVVAYKYDNETFSTQANLIIIVNDVNDQYPKPLQTEYRIEIPEETPMTLNIENLIFHDRDLGEHARYSVRLESVKPPNVADAFYIAPEVGYQRQEFSIGTILHNMLDFENEEFQQIELRVIATDLHTPSNVGVATVFINLTNWNDELPIFPETIPTVTFDETVPNGFHVGTVTATDRDIGDYVVHSLLGNAMTYLRIDEATGDIFVNVDDAFDYHRQNELFVQILAEDTLGEPYNTAQAQLVIQLNDINNTPPTLRLPRGNPSVEENVLDGYVITSDITATDPDTTAELVFSIDWDASYATKQGRETPTTEYHNCVEIKTFYPNENQTGSATGEIVVRSIREGVTIDFEEFEILYLAVRVTDVNTVLGADSDEMMFTIIIIDMNDNPPVWTEGTLQQSFRVREGSASGIVIGSVLATDIDGPLYNQVRYTIFPREDTPENLVSIDFYTGQITVNENGAIDADIPPRENLYYTVIASDKCYAEDPVDCPPDPTFYDVPGDIAIAIIDTNNKIPEALTDEFNTTLYVWENVTSGEELETIRSSDLDRDEIYHTVKYQINYAINNRLRSFFEVDLDTGVLSVQYTTDEVLDRDGDEPEHTIFFTMFDNFNSEGDGNRNRLELSVHVILLDVNDNAPELPTPEQLTWSVLENMEADIRLEPDIYAPDRDKPDTDNSRVGYAILSLEARNRPGLEIPELFRMINIDNVTGELETAMPLRGYWGTYDIQIWAYDHGHPQQSSKETYELVIRPYNFNAPQFVFPLEGTTLRLARENMNGPLTTVSGEVLDRIEATDEDGLQAGEVTFQVVGDDEALQYFSVINEMNNRGALVLTQSFIEEVKEFTVTIRATDGGTEPQSLSTETTFNVVFLPTIGFPVFTETSTSVAFFELEGGLEESYQLPHASDPKNYLCTDDCHDIFYFIMGENEHFSLESTTNTISLSSMLDRTQQESHTVTIGATNSRDAPTAVPPASMLTVTVNVREANPRPIFVRQLYTAGISVLDTVSKVLLTVQARHSENLQIRYTIDQGTMIADPSLIAVQNNAFVLEENTGVLRLNIQPTASMHGLFEFQVVATDPDEATDRTLVKIYLISTQNRVVFLFFNPIEEIERNRDFIAETFTEGFEMQCNIDQILRATGDNGVVLDSVTEVRAHFIRDDEPVDVEYIEQLRSDTELLRSVQVMLHTELLFLQDFVTDSSTTELVGAAMITLYVLAGISAVLAILTVVMFVFYLIRVKTLNRRIEALSASKLGSMDSGLNRTAVAVPGTNKHATEGSNPIWNEQIKAPDFDAISEDSDNSDLIGIEDMPQFKYDYFPPEGRIDDIPNQMNIDKNLPSSSNNFRFNTSPFSSEIGKDNFGSQRF